MEVPRARLTMELAKIKEANGEIAEAATVLQELQVLACCLLFLQFSKYFDMLKRL